jgi:hypothetical protein
MGGCHMDTPKEIIIDILDTGEIKITTKGFSGKSCIEETEFIKEILGEETSRELTPAYYQENGTTVKKHLPLCG